MRNLIILAGGKSSRMGRDKVMLDIDGMPFIERIFRNALEFFERVIISTDTLIHAAQIESIPFVVERKAEIVTDNYIEKGPVGGLCSVFENTDVRRASCISTDVPFADMRVLAALYDRCEELNSPSGGGSSPSGGAHSGGCSLTSGGAREAEREECYGGGRNSSSPSGGGSSPLGGGSSPSGGGSPLQGGSSHRPVKAVFLRKPNGKVEPLIAAYDRSAYRDLKNAAANGCLKLRNAVSAEDTLIADAKSLAFCGARFDAGLIEKAFRNVNTPEDYKDILK